MGDGVSLNTCDKMDRSTLKFDTTILKSIRDPVLIIDVNFTVLWVNHSAAAIHGKTVKELLGKVCYKACWGTSEPCRNCPLKAVKKTNKTNIVEKSAEFPDGTIKWGEVRAFPVFSNKGELLAITAIVVDITDRKKKLDSQKKYNTYLSNTLTKAIQESGPSKTNRNRSHFYEPLTGREIEVLRLMANGLTNREISENLSITMNTVKSHVVHIFNKLGVNDRTHAAVLASRHHLI